MIRSRLSILLLALGLAVLAAPVARSQGPDAHDRARAIAICQARVASALSVTPGEVRFEQSQTRGLVVKTRFSVRAGDGLHAADCIVRRRTFEVQALAVNPRARRLAVRGDRG